MNTLDERLDAAAADLQRAVDQVPIDSVFGERNGSGGSGDAARRTRLLGAAAAIALVIVGLVLIERRPTDPPVTIPERTTTSAVPLFDTTSPPLELTEVPAGYASVGQIIRPVDDGNIRSAVFVKRDTEGHVVAKVRARVGDFGGMGSVDGTLIPPSPGFYQELVTPPTNLPAATWGQIFIAEQSRIIYVNFDLGTVGKLELESYHLDSTTDLDTADQMLAIAATLDLATAPNIGVAGSLPDGWEVAVTGLEPGYATQEFFQGFEVDVPVGGNKILISNWMTSDVGMPFWEMDDTLEPFDVRGHAGFVSTVVYPPTDPNAPPPPNATGSTSLIWLEAPGHWVTLRGDDMSTEQVLALAEQLTPAPDGQWGAVTPSTVTTTTDGPEVSAPPASGDLFDFLWSKSEFWNVLDVAQWNRSLSCMDAQGFTLPPKGPLPEPRIVLYGLPEGSDPSQGFHLPSQGTVIPAEPPDLTHDETVAYTGPNDTESRTIELSTGEYAVTLMGGCLGESQRVLYGSADLYFEAMTLFYTLQDAEEGMYQRVDTAHAMSTLNEEWSACMANAGFGFARPQDAWNFDWPANLSAKEVAAATVDVSCKTSLDFTNRAAAITHEVAASEPQAITDLLGRWFELSAEIVARVQAAE